MRWDIERYVKVYRRDTAEWLSVSWQARGLFYELLRKADRDGCIACGRMEPAAAVAILVRGDASEVAGPLAELFRDGCLEDIPAHGNRGHAICVRNFRAAQGEVKSGAERTADWREKKRAAETEPKSPQVTERDAGDESRDGEHPAEPSLTEPTEPLLLVAKPDGSDDGGAFGRVVDVWTRVCVPAGFAKPHRTAQQQKAAKARMREAGWFDAFEKACAHLVADPFYRGGGDRGWVATLGWLLKPGNAEKTAERADTRRGPVAPVKLYPSIPEYR